MILPLTSSGRADLKERFAKAYSQYDESYRVGRDDLERVYVTTDEGLREYRRPINVKATHPFDLSHIGLRDPQAHYEILRAAQQQSIDPVRLNRLIPSGNTMYEALRVRNQQVAVVRLLREHGFDSIKISDPQNSGRSALVVFQAGQVAEGRDSGRKTRYAYDPNEQRVSKGSEHGGEWTASPEDFHDLADQQRDEPEKAMVKVQFKMGGGVLNPLVENAGDLIHRMAERNTFSSAGWEFVSAKVKSLLNSLTHPYGFEREFNDNIRNNSKYYKKDPGEYAKEIHNALEDYAKAHEVLKPFNRAQQLANMTAIAVGRRRFRDAIGYLNELKSHLGSKDDWVKFAHEGLAGDAPKQLPQEVADQLFAKGMNPATFHEHAQKITSRLDTLHASDPQWQANIKAVESAMANYPMIHCTSLDNIPRIAKSGLVPAHAVGKGFTFDKIAGLDRTVFMRQGQAGGGGHGAVGVMIDYRKLPAERFLVTKLGLMTLKANEESVLNLPGDHRALVDEQLQPFRESAIPLSDLGDVQARLLVDGYMRDHPDQQGPLDPNNVVNNDHGVMEIKYAGDIPADAITAYFAGDQPLQQGGKSASEMLKGVVPDDKLVTYHGEGTGPLSAAYRAHYANVEPARYAGFEASEPRDESGEWTAGAGSHHVDTPEFKKWFGQSKVVDAKGKPLRVYHGTPKSGFSEFAIEPPEHTTENESNRLGIWFTNSAASAASFASKDRDEYFTKGEFHKHGSPVEYIRKVKDTGGIYPVYLSLKNPMVFESTDKVDAFEAMMNDRDRFAQYIDGTKGKKGHWKTRYIAIEPEKTNAQYVADLKAQGYDGIAIRGTQYDSEDDAKVDQFVAFDSSQIKSATGNRGTFDTADPDIRHSRTSRLDGLITRYAENHYDPNEPRVPGGEEGGGEWTSGSGGASTSESPRVAEAAEDWKKHTVKASAFKAWFGDWESDSEDKSKVVDEHGKPKETFHVQHSVVEDEHGKPLVVYHGSAQEFDKFDKSKLEDAALYGPGFYFTEDREVAEGQWDKQAVWKDFPTGEAAEAFRKSQKWPLSGYPVWSDATGEGGVEHPVYKAVSGMRDVLRSPGYTQKGQTLSALTGQQERLLADTLDAKLEEQRKHKYLTEGEYGYAKRVVRDYRANPKFEDAIMGLNGQPYNIQIFDLVSQLGFDIRGHVYPVYLNIRNPFRIDGTMTQDEIQSAFGKEFRQRLDKLCDGLDDGTGGNYMNLSRVGPNKDGYQGSDIYKFLTEWEHGYQTVQGGADTARNARHFAAERLRQAGFDGLTHIGGNIVGNRKHRVWIAFEPTQIKSVENKGTFDPVDPDIRHSRASRLDGLITRYTSAADFARAVNPDRSASWAAGTHYNPDEPRVAKGHEGGGQWTKGGANPATKPKPSGSTPPAEMPQAGQTPWNRRNDVYLRLMDQVLDEDLGNATRLAEALRRWRDDGNTIPLLAAMSGYPGQTARAEKLMSAAGLIPPIRELPSGQLMIPGFARPSSQFNPHNERQYEDHDLDSMNQFIADHLPEGVAAHSGNYDAYRNRQATTVFNLPDGGEIGLRGPDNKRHTWDNYGDTSTLDDRDIHSVPSRLGWDAFTTHEWHQLVNGMDAKTTEQMEEEQTGAEAKLEAEGKRMQEKKREKEEQRQRDEEESSDDDDDSSSDDVGNDIRVSGDRSRYESGSKYYTPRDLVSLAGAQPGSRVKVSQEGRDIRVDVEHPDVTDQTRYIRGDHIYNSLFVVNKESPTYKPGFGARVFSDQVEAATKAGFKYIETSAAGSGEELKSRPTSMNGFYTWPLFGYDAPARGALGRDKLAEATAKFKLGDSPKVSDIFMAPGGPEWWYENGGGTTMKFDLSKGSLSRRRLAKYLHKKFGKGKGWEARSTTVHESVADSEGPAARATAEVRRATKPRAGDTPSPHETHHLQMSGQYDDRKDIARSLGPRISQNFPNNSTSDNDLHSALTVFIKTGDVSQLSHEFQHHWPDFDLMKWFNNWGATITRTKNQAVKPGGALHVASPVTRGELANVLQQAIDPATAPLDLPADVQITLQREIGEFRRTGNAALLRNYFHTRWPGYDIDTALKEHGIRREV